MKRRYLFIILLIISGKAFGQVQKHRSVDTIFAIIDSQRTADDKQNLAKNFTALGQFVSSSSSTLNFKATLFAFRGTFKKSHLVDSSFQTHPFERNFELDLGITPNSSIFNYKLVSAGFTYALINNQALKKKDYDNFYHYVVTNDHSAYLKLSQALVDARNEHPDWQSDIDSLSKKTTKAKINRGLKNYLQQKGFPDPGIVLENADSVFKNMKSVAKNRPLWTLVPNIDYDGKHGWIKDYSLKTSFTLYGTINSGSRVGYTIQPSYSWSDDTLSNTSNITRRIFNTSFSADFTLNKDADGKPNWELKPAITYAHTEGTLYKGEKTDALSFITTVSVKINKDFTLPISIKVTQNKPNFLGFLSIQYSL